MHVCVRVCQCVCGIHKGVKTTADRIGVHRSTQRFTVHKKLKSLVEGLGAASAFCWLLQPT